MSYEQLITSVDALRATNADLKVTVMAVQTQAESVRDDAEAFAVDAQGSATQTYDLVIQAQQAALNAANSAAEAGKANRQYPFTFVAGQAQYDVGVISGDQSVTTTNLALWVEGGIDYNFSIDSAKKFTLLNPEFYVDGTQMRIIVNARFEDLRANFDDLQDVFTAENTANYTAEKAQRSADYVNYLDGLQMEAAVPYAAGLLISRPTQTYTQSGVLYRPKAVSLPFTTSTWGVDAPKSVVANDLALQSILQGTAGNEGVSTVYGAARVVNTVADMKALVGVPIGSSIITLGYFSRGDGGGNIYTTISSSGVTGNLGTNIVQGPIAFRGEFPNGRVLLKQFGSVNDGIANDNASFLEARIKARALGAFLELPIGKTLLNTFTPWDKDKMMGTGGGSGMTEIIFTDGLSGIHISNTAYGVRYNMPPAYIKDIKMVGFTVNAVNVNIGIYSVANLFPYFDDVRVINAKICNWFNGYIFGGKWAHIRADYGIGSGYEFGYNRFNWTAGVPGEAPALCHGASIIRLDCYGNGIGELVRPPLGSVLGAGAVFADGLSNTVMLYYGEQNFGHGLVTVGDVAYAINTVYLEANDKYRPEGTDEYDYHNSAGEMAIANLGPIYTGKTTVWNTGRLVCENFRGTKIDGPGAVKITGNYRNATITNPSVMSIPLLTRAGTAAQLMRGYTLPKSMPADATRRFFRGGAYQCYPEIVFEASAANIAEARIIITNTAGTEMYNQRVFSPANPVAGMRMVFPTTDFTWDNTQNYRLTLSGVTPYTGDMVLSFIADMMA